MGYFSPIKKDKNKKYDEQKRNTVFTQTFIYLLVAGYVLYLYKDIFTDYFAKPGSMSLTGFIAASILMIGGSLFLIVFAIATLPKALEKTELPPEEENIVDAIETTECTTEDTSVDTVNNEDDTND